MRQTLIVLSAAGMLTGLGLVAAQGGDGAETMTGGTVTPTQSQTQADTPAPESAAGLTDASAQRLGRLLLGRHLNLGTQLEVTFYDGDPDADGEALQTLSFTYGEDSEVAFANALATAAEGAAFVRVTTSPQTQTLDLTALPGEARLLESAAGRPFGDGGVHGFGRFQGEGERGFQGFR